MLLVGGALELNAPYVVRGSFRSFAILKNPIKVCMCKSFCEWHRCISLKRILQFFLIPCYCKSGTPKPLVINLFHIRLICFVLSIFFAQKQNEIQKNELYLSREILLTLLLYDLIF